MEFQSNNPKEEIIYWSKRLYQKGMCPATSGNISMKYDKNILISATSTCLNDMDENDIVTIDYNGNLVSGNKKASSEKIMHTEIYTQRDDINAIIHCHCPMITAFAAVGVPMDKPILPDLVVLFGEVPCIPYYCPSTIELAQAVGKEFLKYDAVLMQNHGVVVGAESLQLAFYKVEALRAYAETYFGAEVLGGAKSLSKKDVKELKNLFINR